MGVYIFMAVFMCVCARLRVLARRGNRGLGNLRHTDTALTIDSVLSLWRHYRGFEPGSAFMKYILGRFWSGRKCWSERVSLGWCQVLWEETSLEYAIHWAWQKNCIFLYLFYHQIQVFFPGKEKPGFYSLDCVDFTL